MIRLKEIARSNFLIKVRSWEYWPFGILQFPAILYWLLLSIRERSLVFFSASNPGIPMGGMFGESKFAILEQLPAPLTPLSALIRLPADVPALLNELKTAGLAYPLIFKPDVGERGFMVERISSDAEAENYLRKAKVDFIVQDLVDLPLEFGVLYMRQPGQSSGRVTSVVAKEMLFVTGDGVSSLEDLILGNDRAKLQWMRLRTKFKDRLHDVLRAGERLELVSIGNHALGTRFINANHLINERLSSTFDSIGRSVPGFYFGRFDLRCGSLDDLYAGKIKIMELNGCGAEPAHIYDVHYSFWKAIAVLLRHWHYIHGISRANRRLGFRYTTFREALGFYRKFKSATR